MRLIPVMEWNSKTPSEWDLENLAMYGSRSFEIPKRVQFSSHKIDEVKENGAIYSSGDGSGSDLRHGSTSQNSFSASKDSSIKEGTKTFVAVDGFPKDVSEKEEYYGVDKNGNFPSMGARVSSSEPMIGLKLGRQTYFEDMCAATTAKRTSFSVIPSSSSPTTKRTREAYQSTQTPRCQVEGCNLDLVSAKDYHRRYKICESHSKSPKVIVAGMERRFCQQCSRFHDLSEFDDKKRSCRRRLSDHNARRRRSQPEAIQFSSTPLASSLYDQSPRMNTVPVLVANQTWGSDCNLKVTLAADSLFTPAKVGANTVSSVKGIKPSTLNHNASTITSNLDVAPELRHALSFLSPISWGSNEREPTSLEQLVHGNHISLAQPVTHSDSQNWAVSSLEYVQVQQTPSGSRARLLDFHNTGSTQFQDYQSFKTPQESDCFYSNQINRWIEPSPGLQEWK